MPQEGQSHRKKTLYPALQIGKLSPAAGQVWHIPQQQRYRQIRVASLRLNGMRPTPNRARGVKADRQRRTANPGMKASPGAAV